MSGIFINYRHDETSGEAGRLFDWLSRRFGKDQVFRDVTGDIEPGLEFDSVIEKAVASCDVLIVVIGKKWLAMTDGKGMRRLDDPKDYVRLEVAEALKRDIRVIPVLVQVAVMPAEDQLPEEIKQLSKRQASEISDSRWEYDTGQLVRVLESAGVQAKPSQPPVSAGQAASAPPVEKKFGWKVIASLVLCVLVTFMFSEDGDTESKVGGLAVALIALVLGIAAYYDAKLNPEVRGTRGKVLAITGIALASIL
jgi:hypothetical protein